MQGHIYRRRKSDGTWSNCYAVLDLPRDDDGRRRQRTTTHRTRKQAQAWLTRMAQQTGTGQVPAGPTVGEYLESWLAGKNGLRASTKLSYRGHLHTHLIPQLGHVPLAQLRHEDVQRAYAMLSHPSGGGVASATLHRVHATLMCALNGAVRRGLLERNPAATVELPQVPPRTMRKWTAQEAAMFLESIRSDRWRMLYLLMLATGLRRGEAIALRWGDVDLGEGLVTIRRQLVLVGTQVVEGPPKSQAGGRTVVLDDATLNELRLHALSTGDKTTDAEAHVFTRDGEPLSPAFVSRHFDRLVAAAGVPRIRLHDLRHTSASLGLAAGESLVEVSRRLGHSTIGITADVYTHVDVELARESAERRASLLHARPDRTTQAAPLGRTS